MDEILRGFAIGMSLVILIQPIVVWIAYYIVDRFL